MRYVSAHCSAHASGIGGVGDGPSCSCIKSANLIYKQHEEVTQRNANPPEFESVYVHDSGMKRSVKTYLHSSFQGQKGVARVAHFENASKSVLGQIPNLQYFQLGRDGAQIELIYEDIIDDDGWFGRFIEGGRQEVLSARVEVGVCGQRRPVEVERHCDGSRKALCEDH